MDPRVDSVAVGLLELLVECLRRDLDLLARPVDDLVGLDVQASIGPDTILGEPADHVPPELAEIAVISLAPVLLELGPPANGRVGRHGKGSAPAEVLAGEDCHNG